MKTKRFFTCMAFACVLAAGLLSQENKKLNEDPNTRAVSGVVSDSGSAPAPGATVQLKDLKTLQIRSYVTHNDGGYHFAGLSTNVDYELKADKDGRSSGTKTLSSFDSKKSAVVDLKLK